MTTIRLPRLPSGWQNTPGMFERYWDQVNKQIETSINSILTAQAQAAAAQVTANTVQSQTSLANSYVTGLTISGADTGSSITLTISTHTRMYADGTSVSVNGGTLTGLSYSTAYYIYYDDPNRAGGTVIYHTTTDPTVAAQLNGRHVVGSLTTPASTGGALSFFLLETTGLILLENGTDRVAQEVTVVTVPPGSNVYPPGTGAIP
jgi:hypothetical protein